MACPVIQTSGGTSFIPGLEDRTFAYGFSPSAVEAVVNSDLCVALGTELGEPVHYGKTRHWAERNDIRKWIYVEQDPVAIGVNRPVDVPLVGDLQRASSAAGRGSSRTLRASRRPIWPC
jgi:thiamine pyrophosphate-dependent acetolactate synthase large subunit-like protein